MVHLRIFQRSKKLSSWLRCPCWWIDDAYRFFFFYLVFITFFILKLEQIIDETCVGEFLLLLSASIFRLKAQNETITCSAYVQVCSCSNFFFFCLQIWKWKRIDQFAMLREFYWLFRPKNKRPDVHCITSLHCLFVCLFVFDHMCYLSNGGSEQKNYIFARNTFNMLFVHSSRWINKFPTAMEHIYSCAREHHVHCIFRQ